MSQKPSDNTSPDTQIIPTIKDPLYYAYLSPHKYENSSEILRALESKAPPISLRTYYARREEAIELLSSVLWGHIPIE